MKVIAHSYLWWPKLDQHLEDLAKTHIFCQAVKESRPVALLHPCIWPAKSWKRIHIDFAGPFLRKMLLMVVDAHLKWPKVVQMSSISADQTIMVLQKLFASHGFPLQLVSVNGPQFTANEFQKFTRSTGIEHIHCAPYHPSANGLADHFVQTLNKS